MIPKKINIMGYAVRVRKVKRFAAEKLNIYGRAKCCQGEILLATRNKSGNKISRDGVRNTFLHEIIHHVDDISNLRLSEQQTRGIADGIYQVLKTNRLRFDK